MPRDSSSSSRTNSLAFAKTDCHTCAANQRRCDRKRPRCSPCSGRNVLCGGYPMQLIWPKSKRRAEDMFSNDPFYLEPLSLQACSHLRDKNSSRSRSDRPRKFEFVYEDVPRQKKGSTVSLCEARSRRGSPFFQRSDLAMEETPDSPLLSISEDGIHGHQYNTARRSILNDEHNDLIDPLAIAPPIDCSFESFDWWTWSCFPTGSVDIADSNPSGDADNARSSTPTCIDPQNLIGLTSPSPILHQDLFEKFEPLLRMYDQYFCIVPLSGDIPSNPFRSRLETCRESRSLLHAILAVSCYHAHRQGCNDDYPITDIVDHQNTAVKLYQKEMNSYTKSPQLLDTTMVLFLFRATQGAFNNWETHIRGAGRLLELSGGPGAWVNDPKMQAQVVLLAWWDATISLLSRQGCVLPYSYFEALLSLEDKQHWSFFHLVGCPRELVVPLMQLAHLVEEHEKALSMRWTRFDMTPVDEIQNSIMNWKNNNNNPHIEDDHLSEEEMHQQRDQWHCTEAWRYGLLVYITRVFRWNRETSNPPKRLAAYARVVLDHVQCCRRTSIVQKQAFLPLFFAGCETKDPFSRESILDFSQYWDGASGYDLFNSAASLLQEVWTGQDGLHGDRVWWGSVIDRRQELRSMSGEAPVQLCLG